MLQYTVEEKAPILVIGIECRTSNKSGMQDIPFHWGKFYQEDILNKIPNKVSDEIVALYCDYEGDHTLPYNFVIGCQVTSLDDIPRGMVGKTLPRATYAHSQVSGPYPNRLIDTWNQIWTSDLQRTYSGDFELYGEKFGQALPPQLDVFVAIKES